MSECLAACDRALALDEAPEVIALRTRVVATAPRSLAERTAVWSADVDRYFRPRRALSQTHGPDHSRGHMNGRILIVATTLAGTAALVAAPPSALATYAGRNDTLRTLTYRDDSNDPNTGDTTDSVISSIPDGSAANCHYTGSSNTDDQAPCEIGRIDYSPDGTRIVAERYDPATQTGQLEVLNADGSNVTILPRLTSDDANPAFMPDGTTIIFAGTVNTQTNLYTVNADGAGLNQLTTHGGSVPVPCRNGSIAFINDGALFLRSANGSRVKRLAGRGVLTADCAPNSKSIVYNTGSHVFIVKTKGGKPRKLKNTDGAEYPVFSPNDKRIASLQELPSADAGGNPVDTIALQNASTGRRAAEETIGDNLGVETCGPLAWQPQPRRRAGA